MASYTPAIAASHPRHCEHKSREPDVNPASRNHKSTTDYG